MQQEPEQSGQLPAEERERENTIQRGLYDGYISAEWDDYYDAYFTTEKIALNQMAKEVANRKGRSLPQSHKDLYIENYVQGYEKYVHELGGHNG